jgi:hypothetical protein
LILVVGAFGIIQLLAAFRAAFYTGPLTTDVLRRDDGWDEQARCCEGDGWRYGGAAGAAALGDGSN